MQTRRAMSSAYMEWAKTQSQARFNLANSGVMHFPLAELPVSLEDLDLSGPSAYGYAPLQEALAQNRGVDPDCVMAATGASMANYLAMAVLLEAGDEVLIEQPAYGLLVDVASHLGAAIRRFPRLPEDGFRLRPEAVERAITPRTRLVVLTNLHNPSSSYACEQDLKRVGEIARSVKARVLVDEVYVEAVFDSKPRSCFHLGPGFVATASLTKAYGLSGLRCGWVVAEPDLIRRMWRLNDLFGVIPAHPAELLSCVALAHLDLIERRARALLDANRALFNRFLSEAEGIECAPLEHGTVVFPRLTRAAADRFCALLRERYETSVVPGGFFESPAHIRIGIGGDTAVLAAGLDRIAEALRAPIPFASPSARRP